jgi:peptide-methionine (S)-S-oxide reductase
MSSRSAAASLSVLLIFTFAANAPDEDKNATTAGSPSTTKDASSKSADPGKTADTSPKKKTEKPARPRTEKATFGAGCFWHVEDTFENLKGVKSAVSGYAGGNVPYPSYEMVHTGLTGHAEVVQVVFDPDIISYEQLLKVFWSCHDPTSVNRQGEDEGPQYRSVIFYHNLDQKEAAFKSYEELTRAGVYGKPIVTQLAPMRAFYRAEDYHQDYYGGKRRVSSRAHKAVAPRTAKVTRKTTGAARGAKLKAASPANATPSQGGNPVGGTAPPSEP